MGCIGMSNNLAAVLSYPAYLRGRIEYLLADPDNLLGGNLIGTYSSQTTNEELPAIWVGDPPQRFIISGLEVIIQKIPPKRTGYQLSNPEGQGKTKLGGIQVVTLRQFPISIPGVPLEEIESSELETIEAADDRMVRWLSEFDAVVNLESEKNGVMMEVIYQIPFNWQLDSLGHNNTP
jgi:hypothetical protein